MRKIFFIVVTVLGLNGVMAGEFEKLSIPSNANAKYYVLEKSGIGDERVIVTKRVGSSGESYSKRLYNCADSTVKYLGDGDSLEEMNSSKEDKNLAPIVEGSIAHFVGIEACE